MKRSACTVRSDEGEYRVELEIEPGNLTDVVLMVV